MFSENSLDELKERFEKLVSRDQKCNLSDVHRRGITNKFAGKSLQELYDLVQQLKSPSP